MMKQLQNQQIKLQKAKAANKNQLKLFKKTNKYKIIMKRAVSIKILM